MNIQQVQQYKILLIGDDCLEVYQYGTVDRINISGGETIGDLIRKKFENKAGSL